jgi:hypothetical protein
MTANDCEAMRRPVGLGRLLSVLALAGLALTVPSIASADAKVIRCQTADEPGLGNLRQALTAPLNPNTGANTITFQCGGPATIDVSQPPLEILQATVIDGAGAVTLTSSNTTSRAAMFVVGTSGNFFQLHNMTLTRPNTPKQVTCNISSCTGTLLNAQGVTQLDNVVIQNTDTPISVFSGSLTVSQSQFTGNTGNLIVAPPGATTTITGSGFQDNIGATPLLASGTVNITGTSFFGQNVRSFFASPCQLNIDNGTFEGNANGALWAACASVSITNSVFGNNTAQGIGGALLLFSAAQKVTLRADRFLSNTAPQDGGAIMLAPGSADRSLVIDHTAFTGNHSGGAGGAINIPAPAVASAKTTLALRRVSFSRNAAAGTGGAIEGFGTEVEATQTVFADNESKVRGGAVALDNAAPLQSVFANTLFIRNTAPTGSAYSADDAEFINVTIDGNQGLAIESRASRPAAIRLINSIVSNNPKGGCGAAGPPGGGFTDGGHNLQFPGNDCGASIPVADPHLDTLYIPPPSSPPLGHGDLAVCMGRPVGGRDVYGSARPSGGACAIGAAEGVPPKLVPCQHPTLDQPDIRACYRNLVSQLQKILPGSH